MSPASGATVAIPATLTWQCANATCYEVYFIQTSVDELPIYVGVVYSGVYSPTMLKGESYRWKIIARNGGQWTPSPIYSFTTIP